MNGRLCPQCADSVDAHRPVTTHDGDVYPFCLVCQNDCTPPRSPASANTDAQEPRAVDSTDAQAGGDAEANAALEGRAATDISPTNAREDSERPC